MKRISETDYRQTINQLVQAMSWTDRPSTLGSDLSQGSTVAAVQLFVQGNAEKRMDKLLAQLAFVADAFDDFEQLVEEFMGASPLAAYDSGMSDGDRMLAWLQQAKTMSLVQQDYVTCQRARHAVEKLARENRLKHIRFQELCSLVPHWLDQLSSNSQLRLHLNPIRHWSQFATQELLDEEDTAPANVLFFATGNQVGTAILELEGQALINELTDYTPCTLGQWARLTSHARQNCLVEICKDLAEMGLVAFG